jgi:hypothetical protein
MPAEKRAGATDMGGSRETIGGIGGGDLSADRAEEMKRNRQDSGGKQE